MGVTWGHANLSMIHRDAQGPPSNVEWHLISPRLSFEAFKFFPQNTNIYIFVSKNASHVI